MRNTAYSMSTHVSTQVSKLVGMEMTIREAALHLNVSVNTVRRRLLTGVLKGTKVGTQWVLTIDWPDDGVAPSEPEKDNGQQSEVTWLREQLEARTREIAELHQLLAVHSLNPGQTIENSKRESESLSPEVVSPEVVNAYKRDIPWWAFWRWMWP